MFREDIPKEQAPLMAQMIKNPLLDLRILKNPCIPGIKPTWSWCMILFARILLRIFASMFISDIGL